jgi:hypothetical protein
MIFGGDFFSKAPSCLAQNRDGHGDAVGMPAKSDTQRSK